MRTLKQINAEEWQRRRGDIDERYRLKHRYRIALERLLANPPARWIDIGAGNGYLASVVKSRLPGVHVAGVDFVEEMVKGAEALDEARVVDLDEADLPFEDAGFDYATCLDVIEHLVLPDHALVEIFRVLRPGGHALCSVPNMQFIEYLLALARGKMPHPARDMRHMSIYTLRFLAERMKKAGFDVVFTAGCDASPPFLARVSKRYLAKTVLVEGLKSA